MKNDEEWSWNQSWKCYGSASALIFLLLTNFSQILLISNAGSFLQLSSRLFIGNKGWRLHSSSPRQAGYFIPKLSSGPRGWKMSQKWPFCPFFWIFCTFPSGTSQNPTDCATISVKQLNSVDKNPNVGKQSSLDEIRVWQLPLFTYHLLEIKKGGKDKDINFVRVISPSDWPLAKA